MYTHIAGDGTKKVSRRKSMTLVAEVEWRAECELARFPKMTGRDLWQRSYRWDGPVLSQDVADYLVFSHQRSTEMRSIEGGGK